MNGIEILRGLGVTLKHFVETYSHGSSLRQKIDYQYS